MQTDGLLQELAAEALEQAMAELGAAIVAVRRQHKAAGAQSEAAPAAKAAVRQKAKTGMLKPARMAVAAGTGPVGPRVTRNVGPGSAPLPAQAGPEHPGVPLQADPEWESLSDLAKQNQTPRRRGPNQPS